jgi:SAM-dependent methyltransferase
VLDLIDGLPPGARVLDLGARTGSFHTNRTDLVIVRVDLEIAPARGDGYYLATDAARLPFRTAAFDLIISNHSLEHFEALAETLREIGRVIRPGGALYVAVPDAGTLTDRIYRWLARGGGHVNAFRSAGQVTALVEKLTGLSHQATRDLYSSLSFLNRRNFTARPPRKIALFAFGNERFLAILMWILRMGSGRLSRYGWAFYFGEVRVRGSLESWINVCVRCGAGHSEPFLRKSRVLVRRTYRCPDCGGWNLLTRSPSTAR